MIVKEGELTFRGPPGADAVLFAEGIDALLRPAQKLCSYFNTLIADLEQVYDLYISRS